MTCFYKIFIILIFVWFTIRAKEKRAEREKASAEYEKSHVKGAFNMPYERYMDDFILIHESKEYLQYCREKIEEFLKKKGFKLNQKKTKVYSLRKGITFLGFTFKLTDTGKVIFIRKPKNVKQERKKLYRLVQQAKRGEKPKAKVDECYNGWRNHAAKGNSTKLLRRMDKYYKDLWKGEA